MTDDQPTTRNSRSFSLNSREFYEAVTPPADRSRWGPGLPREPKARDPDVIIEAGGRKR